MIGLDEAFKFAESTGLFWDIHYFRSEGYVCHIDDHNRDYRGQNANPAVAIYEAYQKWEHAKKGIAGITQS